tara:strand:+ start:1894 stop:4434 length:2541 start_codon:yes stop_codon:yes gene_type:complete
MANKYSKYQITPFVSDYVDPQSVQVNQILRQRFEKNKAGKDLIDRTLNTMEVMPGDQVILEDVKKNVRGMLGSVVEQGNYEDSGLIVQDAASWVDGHKGLYSAKQSMANRQLELNFIKEQRMQGNQVLDFGQDAAKSHSSYYYDTDKESFVADVYEPMSELMLDYDKEMRDLLVTIKPDQYGGAEGISRAKTDRIASLLYNQYITTNAGIQDMKRLMQLELPQNVEEGERMQLAKKDILNRIRSLTRQYEYSKVTGTGGTGVPGVVPGTTSSGTQSNALASETTEPVMTSLNNLMLLKSTENQDDPAIQQQIQLHQQLIENTIKKAAKENNDPALYQEWEAIQNVLNQPGDEKFAELVNLLVSPDAKFAHTQELQDVGREEEGEKYIKRGLVARMWQGMITGGTVGGLWGMKGGTVVMPGVGTVAGGIGMGLLGAIGGGLTAAFYGGAEDLLEDINDYDNVRKNRYDGFNAGNWEKIYNSIVDTESEQLNDELFGGDDGFSEKKLAHLNKTLGTNYTQDDYERLNKGAHSIYNWMVNPNDANGNKRNVIGDQVYKEIGEKGMSLDREGVTTSGDKTGRENQKQLDFALQKLDPQKDIVVYGHPTSSKSFKEWIAKKDSKGEIIKGNDRAWYEDATVVATYPADPLTNTPFMMEVRIGDDSKLVMLPEGANGDRLVRGNIDGTPAWLDNITQTLGPKMKGEEVLRRDIQNIRILENREPTVNDYLTRKAVMEIAYMGGDPRNSDLVKQKVDQLEKALFADKLLFSDPMSQGMSIDPRYAGLFTMHPQTNEPYFQYEPGKFVPMVIDGQINETGIQAFMSAYPDQAEAMLKSIRAAELSTLTGGIFSN